MIKIKIILILNPLINCVEAAGYRKLKYHVPTTYAIKQSKISDISTNSKFHKISSNQFLNFHIGSFLQ
jgi:hypothetical protein